MQGTHPLPQPLPGSGGPAPRRWAWRLLLPEWRTEPLSLPPSPGSPSPRPQTLTPDPGNGSSATCPPACSDSRTIPTLARTGCVIRGCWPSLPEPVSSPGKYWTPTYPPGSPEVSGPCHFYPHLLLKQNRKPHTLLPFSSSPLCEAGPTGSSSLHFPAEEAEACRRAVGCSGAHRGEAISPSQPEALGQRPFPSPAPPLVGVVSSGLPSGGSPPSGWSCGWRGHGPWRPD